MAAYHNYLQQERKSSAMVVFLKQQLIQCHNIWRQSFYVETKCKWEYADTYGDFILTDGTHRLNCYQLIAIVFCLIDCLGRTVIPFAFDLPLVLDWTSQVRHSCQTWPLLLLLLPKSWALFICYVHGTTSKMQWLAWPALHSLPRTSTLNTSMSSSLITLTVKKPSTIILWNVVKSPATMPRQSSSSTRCTGSDKRFVSFTHVNTSTVRSKSKNSLLRGGGTL